MRVTSPAVTIKDIWDALVADYGVAGSYGLLLETNLDGKVSEAKADVSALALEATVDAVGAIATAIEADTTGIAGAAMRGTDAAALASAWTAALATILGNLSATRIGYLDNIDSSLKQLFWEHFHSCVDDLVDVAASGTATDPTNAIDNDTATQFTMDAVDEYVEIDLKAPTYIKEFRYYGNDAHNQDGEYKIEGWAVDSWIEVKTGVATRLGSWSAWTGLAPPYVVTKIRITATALDTAASQNVGREWEFKGVRIG